MLTFSCLWWVWESSGHGQKKSVEALFLLCRCGSSWSHHSPQGEGLLDK